APPPSHPRHRVLRGLLRAVVLLILLGGVGTLFLVLALGVELPGMAAHEEKTTKKPAPLGVKLGTRYEISDQVCDALRNDGVREGVLLKLKKLKDKEFKKKAGFIAKLKEVLLAKEEKDLTKAEKDAFSRIQAQILARAIKDEHTLQ